MRMSELWHTKVNNVVSNGGSGEPETLSHIKGASEGLVDADDVFDEDTEDAEERERQLLSDADAHSTHENEDVVDKAVTQEAPIVDAEAANSETTDHADVDMLNAYDGIRNLEPSTVPPSLTEEFVIIPTREYVATDDTEERELQIPADADAHSTRKDDDVVDRVGSQEAPSMNAEAANREPWDLSHVDMLNADGEGTNLEPSEVPPSLTEEFVIIPTTEHVATEDTEDTEERELQIPADADSHSAGKNEDDTNKETSQEAPAMDAEAVNRELRDLSHVDMLNADGEGTNLEPSEVPPSLTEEFVIIPTSEHVATEDTEEHEPQTPSDADAYSADKDEEVINKNATQDAPSMDAEVTNRETPDLSDSDALSADVDSTGPQSSEITSALRHNSLLPNTNQVNMVDRGDASDSEPPEMTPPRTEESQALPDSTEENIPDTDDMVQDSAACDSAGDDEAKKEIPIIREGVEESAQYRQKEDANTTFSEIGTDIPNLSQGRKAFLGFSKSFVAKSKDLSSMRSVTSEFTVRPFAEFQNRGIVFDTSWKTINDDDVAVDSFHSIILRKVAKLAKGALKHCGAFLLGDENGRYKNQKMMDALSEAWTSRFWK